MPDIKKLIRTIPNYPKPEIMFRDVTTLFKDAKGMRRFVERLYEKYKDADIDLVVGIEARGFIIGSALAFALNKGFVPIRKKGKLPAATISKTYQLEYGQDEIEIHTDAIQKGQKVLITDDLLATGGTAIGAIELVEELGGIVQECCFIVDLPELGGRAKLTNKGYSVHFLTEFEGE